MKLLKILNISLLVVALMFSGCTDSTAETGDNITLQNNLSINESSTNISKTEPGEYYENSTDTTIKSDSAYEKHDAYILGYPDRTDKYYLENPEKTEILDNLALKLDNVISEDYILECCIKTYEEDPKYPECNATILSDRLIINEEFITGAVETINYINETYKINRVLISAIDAETGEKYCSIETSGQAYENIELIFKYRLGDEFQITYWNGDMNNYTIEKLN
ncbi:hypothetical protein [Methanococcus maripaludis]|uniref:Lipoprotein n=1 Tax=Methanococcus maripaludis (strain DSM 14266 / JCM 13030 / NBRC 101832 / S2 / LL) TaxID=267377 RepID=Q6LZ31_METMP|nr:hypothetical protein [Methanococcus maripaludis]CAF30354.1 hypothetical protein MMP0798 [Methanococcus maripaludis S2]